MQRYRKLTYGTQLKLTISKYYTPSGRCIQELDYTHRDENGDVPKFSDKKINPFKTKNGRTVYDGGGIEPDVKLKKEEKTNATKALLKSDAIFNYATNYYNKNPEVASSREYIFTDDDYQQFLNYLKSDDDVFKTETELQFDQALIASETEGYKSKIEQEYQKLVDKIKIEKINDLSNNKSEINEIITNEIVRRYYYKKGEYIHKVHHDKSIIEAINILKNENKYQNILK